MISADAYATAIVAAARLTGEDPESFVDRDPECRFRHYALHALLNVYPDARPGDVSNALGCPGKPTFFPRSSLWFVLGQGPHRKVPAEWWDNVTLGLVIEAVLKVTPLPAPKVVPRPVPSETPQTPSQVKPATPKPVLRQPPPPDAPDRGAARSGMDRFSARFGRPPLDPDSDPLTRRAVERGKSYDLLAEAARNTAALQAKLPPEPEE